MSHGSPHGFEHVIGQLAARPVRLATPERHRPYLPRRYLGYSPDSLEGQSFCPLMLTHETVTYWAAEGVRVRNLQCAVRSVNLNRR